MHSKSYSQSGFKTNPGTSTITIIKTIEFSKCSQLLNVSCLHPKCLVKFLTADIRFKRLFHSTHTKEVPLLVPERGVRGKKKKSYKYVLTVKSLPYNCKSNKSNIKTSGVFVSSYLSPLRKK